MITIEYCGYHTHNPDCDIILRPSGTNSYLFILVLSPMTFYFSGNITRRVKPGACILYSPGQYQHYQADQKFFNSYVHFFCPKDIINTNGIKLNSIFYPDNTEELNWLLKKIYQEFINKLSQSEQMMELYVRQLLILLQRGQLREGFPLDQGQTIYSDLLRLREVMLESCEQHWTIERMCKVINLGKSQLYHYYQLFFHTTPKEELILARLQKAKYLMNNDAVTIKQAAYASGFNNICHFNRIFKLQFGCTPGEYRETHF